MDNNRQYNENAAALNWEIVNESTDIGKWKLWYLDNLIEGQGFEEFFNAAKTLSSDMNVVFVKRIKWFIHLAKNFVNFKDRNFFANSEQDFFFIEIDDNIELRNWDNFWKKIEDGADFLKRLEVCRSVFNHGENGKQNKNKLSLKNHYKWTLSKEMWKDIYNQNYLYYSWGYNYCSELVPQDDEELEYVRWFDKAGFYFRNPKFSFDVIPNIFHYDIKSDYLGLLFRKTFPMEKFQWTEDPEEIQKIIKDGYYCWYGSFDFIKLQYKQDFHLNLQRFGTPIEGQMCSWSLLLTNVDMQWFKTIFKWEKCYSGRVYYTRHRRLSKDYLKMFEFLFSCKESQKDGTFAKEIYKTRAELVFGQPIKAFEYASKTIYVEEENDFEVVDNDEKSLEKIQFDLKKRGIPYYVGVWVAAYARAELINVVNKLGFDNVVYGDTDSVWFINEEGINIIEEHNKEIRKEKKGTIPAPLLGEWINQGQYRNFKSVAVKMYICEKLNEKTGEWELIVKAAGADTEIIKQWLLKKKKPFAHFSVNMKIPQMRYTIERKENRVEFKYLDKVDKEELFKAQKRETSLYYFNPYEGELK